MIQANAIQANSNQPSVEPPVYRALDLLTLSDEEVLAKLDSATETSPLILLEAIERDLVVFSSRQYRYIGDRRHR
jgi:hypothetical protein